MHGVAQTHLQLFNQLIAAGWSEDDLGRTRRAYDLQVELFGGSRTQSGKYHEAHNIGTASILAAAGADATVVGAGLLHNAYNAGDFGDGVRGSTAQHREEVRSVLGSHGEACVELFEKRHRWSNADALSRPADTIDAVERDARLVWLAEQLDHHIDVGFHYRQSLAKLEKSVAEREQLVDLARAAGRPNLTDRLEESFRAEDRAEIPAMLRATRPGQHDGVSRSWVGGPGRRRSPLRDRMLVVAGRARRLAGRGRRAARRRLRRSSEPRPSRDP